MSRHVSAESQELQNMVYQAVLDGLTTAPEIRLALNIDYFTARYYLERLRRSNTLVKESVQGSWVRTYLPANTMQGKAIVCRYIVPGDPKAYYTSTGWVKVKKSAQVMTKIRAGQVKKEAEEILPMFEYKRISL